MSERLGRYILERQLAVGGMAEVFLAHQAGPEGFAKQCVVKRMLPPLAAEAQFVRMFLDEARLAAQLNHPNIAQIFDFGEADGTFFLAMEYVPGSSLRAIVKDHARRQAFIPVHLAARLASQAAVALDYAHGAVGVDGKKLEIIHRDVSPHNILLGTSGAVKLIDFGVAKAATATQKTATGMIKGKFAYMSPEQIRGLPLDPRSDIFGMGLVLYELLASGRALQGDTDAALMHAALKMRFDPIEQRRPDLPEALRGIVSRCLQQDREARYPTAAALSADLEAFLTREGRTVSGVELACLLGGLAPARPARTGDDSSPGSDSSKHIPLAAQPAAVSLPQPFWEAAAVAPTVMDPALAVNAPPAVGSEEGRALPTARAVPPGLRPRGDPAAPPPPAATEVWPAPDASPAAAPLGPQGPDGIELRSPGRRPAPLPVSEPALKVADSSATLVRKGVRKSPLPWVLSGAVVLAGVALVAFVVLSSPPAQDRAPLPNTPSAIAVGPQDPAPTPAPAAPLTPSPTPSPMKPAPVAPPLAAKPPPAAVPVAPGPRPAKAFAPLDSATLFVTSEPPMQVWIDEKPRGSTPLQAAVSSGDHNLLLKDERLGLVHRRTVRLAQGEERREEWRAGKGKVLFRVVPYAEVFLAGQSLGLTPLDPIELREGSHAFRFVNKESGRSETREVLVAPGQETLVKVDLRPK